MSERPPPDFNMVRAVEILAKLAGERSKPSVPPPPLDRPVILFNERQAFKIGETKRADVERELGTGFPFPATGWHTYGIAGRRGEQSERWLLSAFYRDDVLVGVEHYIPKLKNAPELAAREYGGFRLIPGEIALGSQIHLLDGTFVPARGGPSPIIYELALEARYPGGVAYAMGNGGVIERLVLYSADA